jgi:hypothetical protein
MKLTKTYIAMGSLCLGFAFIACSGTDSNSGTTWGTGAATGSGGSGAGGSGTGGVSTGPCTPGDKQCNGLVPEICDSKGAWQTGAECPFMCSAGACTGECTPGSGQCKGVTPQTCDATGKWQDGTACPFVCSAGACSGVCLPGDVQCKLDTPQTCGADGLWANGTPCPYGCDQGKCKDACVAGEFHCEGNEVQMCDVGPPPTWVSKSPQTICNPTSGQACDATTGTCVTLAPIGSSTPTGTYYQYATFGSGDGFQTPAYDVDSFENYIYVNRGSYMDVYQVALLDTDGDGKLEPDQHPSNPLNTGPMEQRTLTLVKSYSKATDGVPLGGQSTAEIYALADRVYMLGPTHSGTISEFMLNTNAVSTAVAPSNTLGLSQMGFGDLDGKWYGSSDSLQTRTVFSYHAPSNQWVAEFKYPDLAGSHMDGMEVIVSPKTGEQYVFVSDMTSDFIGQYRKDPTGWTQVNLFQYTDTASALVEGMGFGAFNHFWATSGTLLYELGGGDLAQWLE